jgi:hypothetical protein
MLTKIVSFERFGDHGLRLVFNDGSCGIHDFAAMVTEPGACSGP